MLPRRLVATAAVTVSVQGRAISRSPFNLGLACGIGGRNPKDLRVHLAVGQTGVQKGPALQLFHRAKNFPLLIHCNTEASAERRLRPEPFCHSERSRGISNLL